MSEWIKCEDDLPPATPGTIGKEYIVLLLGKVTAAYFRCGAYGLDGVYPIEPRWEIASHPIVPPTHWMRMPAAPVSA